MTRFARSPQHGVHAEVHVGDDVTSQDDLHKLACIGQRHVAGSEEAEDRVKEHETDHHKHEADQHVERHRVAQQMLGRLVVTLPQLDADTRRSPYPHGGAKGCTEVHEGEGHGQAIDGIGTNDLTYRGTVDDVIERRGRHRDDGGQRILRQQPSYGFLSQLQGGLSVVLFCIHNAVQRYKRFSIPPKNKPLIAFKD